ncbi:MAG: hypothetical protein K8F91_01935, partial [Candidatus Obscuribacterales bacterium]|nr:hypothetical protein [Candidatus Obscuribacterales bacterium]
RPTSESGLYDYITWSLAPLIAPHLMVESEHLAIDEAYFELLEDLLRGTIALTRIAHARSLPEKEPLTSDAPAASQLKISPKISVEPLPTFYYRRAYSYRFLKSVASSLFGPDGLKKLRRMTPDGPVEVDLYSELTFMEDLFNGAHISSCKDLGMKPAQTPEASLAVFSLWAKKHFQDPDLARDQRMMVPISYDIESGLSKVWCFLGWRKEELIVSFEKPPEVEVFDKDGRKLARRDLWLRPRAPVNKADANKVEESDEISYSFEPAVFAGYYPVMEELYVKDILERSEFQKLCDKHKALSKIVKALTPR